MKIDLTKAYREGYTFDYNSYFSKAWKRFGADYGSFIGMNLLFFVITIVVSLIPIVGIFNGLVSAVLYAGFYIYCRNMDRGTEKPGDFFAGFPFLGQIFLYNLVIFLLIIPLLFITLSAVIPLGVFMDLVLGNIQPYEFENQFEPEMISNIPIFMLGIFIFTCLAIYISVSFVFTIPLIVDAKQSFWQAMELSRKTVGRNFFSFLLFWIVYGIVASIGVVITCGIGLLLFIPFTYLLTYEMYNQIFEPEPSGYLDENDHLSMD